MTVGSPPSMTATTEFVVPRSMPMILPMSLVAPVVSRCAGSGKGRWVGGARHGHECRADDSVAEAVPAADLFDDRAVGLVAAGHVGDRLVLARIEWTARRGVDRRHAFALEQQAELPVDRGQPLEPGVLGDRPRTRLDGAIEV